MEGMSIWQLYGLGLRLGTTLQGSEKAGGLGPAPISPYRASEGDRGTLLLFTTHNILLSDLAETPDSPNLFDEGEFFVCGSAVKHLPQT